jgi:hypothetical protein
MPTASCCRRDLDLYPRRQNGIRLSKRDKEEICKWYGKGATVAPLAVVYGVTTGAIYQLLRRRGVSLRTNDRYRERNSIGFLLNRSD